MIDTSLLLDLTRRTAGVDDTLAACRALAAPGWELLALHCESQGAAVAARLGRDESRVRAVTVGSGMGAGEWAAGVRAARGRRVVFLHPGDRLVPAALTHWHAALGAGPGTRWALARVNGARHDGWWHQPELADSAAALLVLGAAFPECGACVSRDAWLDVAARVPAAAADATRAAAWLALALAASPALAPQEVAADGATPSQVDPPTLAAVLHQSMRQAPARTALVMADVSRLASGMRVAHELLVEGLHATARCLGTPPSARVAADEWHRRWQLHASLLARGSRPIWIWGAGQLGRQAQRWLDAHAIPMAGFLDRDPARDGATWGGRPVRHADGLLDRLQSSDARPLIVVASMYHPEIAARLEGAGLHRGADFVTYDPHLPWLTGAEAAR